MQTDSATLWVGRTNSSTHKQGCCRKLTTVQTSWLLITCSNIKCVFTRRARVAWYLQLLTCLVRLHCLCLQVLPQPCSLFRGKAALETVSVRNIDQVSKVWQSKCTAKGRMIHVTNTAAAGVWLLRSICTRTLCGMQAHTTCKSSPPQQKAAVDTRHTAAGCCAAAACPHLLDCICY
jgi:hypothetical protein